MTKVFLLSKPVLFENKDFTDASRPRKSITEDYLGHLDIRGKCFWEVMAIYRLFLEERENYGEQCKLYNSALYKRYDLLLYYKILSFLIHHNVIRKLLINIFVK